MTFEEFDYQPYKPTAEEHKLRVYIESLRERMNSPYRLRAIQLAEWARRDYEGMSDVRITNLDIMKVSLSYPIVNQRLSSLYANPSTAIFRTVDQDKEDDLEIYKQVDEYDKQVGRYNSDYQEIQQVANIEGSCFFRVNWEENYDEDGNTIGVPHCRLRRIRMNDMYWDVAARTTREMNHGIERQVLSYEEFLRLYLPKDGKEGFKNIRMVIPRKDSEVSGSTWEEKWEEFGRDVWGDTVTCWIFESKGYVTKTGVQKKAAIVANGVVIYESDELFTPKNKESDEDLLMWSKIDGIPTGSMVGMGIPVLIRHPQEAFNRLLTLSVAQAELSTSPPLFLRPQADQDMDDYPVMPGATIPIRGSGRNINEDYQFLNIPDISNGAQKMMNDLIEYMIMLTGVDVRALFVPASEKAITTENKRQIQEKMLRFSVQWNEENGFYEMQRVRMRLIQHYYPQKRYFLEESQGQMVQVERTMQIPVTDYEVVEGLPGTEGKLKLKFKKGAYTKIDITPENLDFNIDIVMEGAQTVGERDIIAQRNFIEHLQIVLSIPQFAQKIDPDKGLKMLLKRMNIPEDEVIEIPNTGDEFMHPAIKEISAINIINVLEDQGFRFPEDIPHDDDYNPTAYVEIFSSYMQTDDFKRMSVKSKSLFQERFRYHNDNAANPYYMEIRADEEEKRKEQAMGAQAEELDGSRIPTPKPRPEESPLMQTVRSEAGELAAEAREDTA